MLNSTKYLIEILPFISGVKCILEQYAFRPSESHAL